jgi:hypothetical protein
VPPAGGGTSIASGWASRSEASIWSRNVSRTNQ